MTRRTLPDGIEDESRHPPSLERGVWGRRVFVTVLMAIVVLALANVFGQAMTASEASSSQATIRVEAPSALRGGLLYQVVFTVTQTSTASAFQVPFKISDSCSAEHTAGPTSPLLGPVNKFVGGGKDSLGN